MPGPLDAPPFADLEDRLLRAGVAPRHVRRYLRELTEHLADLTEAQRAAGYDGEDAALRARALLGPDEELAAAMDQPRFQSLAARFPWLAFTLLPPLLTLVGLALPVLLLAGLARGDEYLLGHHGMPAPGWFRPFAETLAGLCNFAVLPLVALLLTVTAWRQRLNAGWLLLSAALLLGLVAQMGSEFPTAAELLQHKKGTLSIGMGYRLGFDGLLQDVAARRFRGLVIDALILLPPMLLLLARWRLRDGTRHARAA